MGVHRTVTVAPGVKLPDYYAKHIQPLGINGGPLGTYISPALADYNTEVINKLGIIVSNPNYLTFMFKAGKKYKIHASHSIVAKGFCQMIISNHTLQFASPIFNVFAETGVGNIYQNDSAARNIIVDADLCIGLTDGVPDTLVNLKFNVYFSMLSNSTAVSSDNQGYAGNRTEGFNDHEFFGDVKIWEF